MIEGQTGVAWSIENHDQSAPLVPGTYVQGDILSNTNLSVGCHATVVRFP